MKGLGTGLLQVCVALVLAAAAVHAVNSGWLGAPTALAPTRSSLWQQGVWPLQDQLADEIRARLPGTASPTLPWLVEVTADTTNIPAGRFSTFTAADLASSLNQALEAAGSVRVVPAPSATTPDLTLQVTLESYRPGPEQDELTGRAVFKPRSGPDKETPFHLQCPAFGRDWFIRCSRPPGVLLLAAALALLMAACLASWGARDVFKGRYDGSRRMSSVALVLPVGAVLLLFYLCEPGFSRFEVPRRRVGVALDASDAVRFPPTPSAGLPVPGQGFTNNLCRFIGYCVAELGQELEPPADRYSAADFIAWLRELLSAGRDGRRQTRLLKASEGLEITHSHPYAGESSSKTGAAERVAPAEVSDWLGAGHRGRAPGFFLPWPAEDGTNAAELVVAFQTGEPSSARQARWLRSERETLRALKPPGLRVVSVLLPSVARSAAEDWTSAACLRNVTAVSDTIFLLDDDPRPPERADTPLVRTLPLFKMNEANRPEPGDLDAARTRLFQAAESDMRQAARRIVEEVRGLADVRGTTVFLWRPKMFCAVGVLLACLALFLGLMRENDALDKPGVMVGKLEWLGALMGLAFALGVALLIGYAVSEPARWKTSTSPGLVVWSIVTIWYAGCWLPMLLGRGLGHLPRPIRALDLTWPWRWFLAAMFFQIVFLVFVAAKFWVVRDRASDFFDTALQAAVWVSLALALALAMAYGWTCFYRPTRRRAFWSGFAGLAIVCALPALAHTLPESMPSNGGLARAGALLGAAAVAMFLPVLLPLFPRRQSRFFESNWSLGWAPVRCFLGGAALALTFYGARPLDGWPFGWLTPGILPWIAAVGAWMGIVIGVWLFVVCKCPKKTTRR